MLLDRGVLAQQGNRYVVASPISDLESRRRCRRWRRRGLTIRSPRAQAAPGCRRAGDLVLPGGSGGRRRASRRRGPPDARRAGRQAGARSRETTSAQASRASITSSRRCCARSLSARCRGAIARPVTSRLAGHLRSAYGDATEIAEVLASHYLEAVEADPDAADADVDPRTLARETLVTVGAACRSLVALGGEARRLLRARGRHSRAMTPSAPSLHLARGRLGGGTHRGPRLARKMLLED